MLTTHRDPIPEQRTLTLPAEPLLTYLQATGHDFGDKPSIARAVNRARQHGRLTIWAADSIAITGLGLHPALIWGNEWFHPTDTPAQLTATHPRSCAAQDPRMHRDSHA